MNFWPDEDGVVRRAQFRQTSEEARGNVQAGSSAKVYESLAARMIRKAGVTGLIPNDPGGVPRMCPKLTRRHLLAGLIAGLFTLPGGRLLGAVRRLRTPQAPKLCVQSPGRTQRSSIGRPLPSMPTW